MRNKVLILVQLAVSLMAPVAVAAVPNGPLYWARSGFNDDSQAIAHVTICGQDSAGHDDLFVRLYVANAGFKHGALMHPVTYSLKGQAVGEIQGKASDPALTLDPFAVCYKYAQAHST